MKKIIITILKSTSFFILWAILVGLPIPTNVTPEIWRFLAELEPLILMILMTYFYMKFIDKKIYDLKLKDNNIRNYLIAIIIGMLWIFMTLGILFLLKVLNIESVNKVNIMIWSISLLLNTAMQELLVRGYLYQMIKEKYNIIVALIVTTCLFTLMHGGAFEAGFIAVVNVITTNLFMVLLLEYYNSLYVPIIVHYIWNLVGGLIFGVVSLADDYPFIFNTNSIGNILLSGGMVKIEGSIIVTIINLILIIIYIFLLRNKKIQFND